MINHWMRWLIFLSIVLGSTVALGQEKPNSSKKIVYTYGEAFTEIWMARQLSSSEIDSFNRQFALEELELQQLLSSGNLSESAKAAGWQIVSMDAKTLSVRKAHPTDWETADQVGTNIHGWENRILLADHFIPQHSRIETLYPSARSGINRFKSPHPSLNQSNGLVHFYLKGHEQAKSVFLAGSFNRWVTDQLPMQRTADGWTCQLRLEAGKHLYKFVIDGQWASDPANLLQEADGYRGQNSVFFVYNHVFRFEALPNAKKVTVLGSFNDWEEQAYRLEKTANGWELPIYLSAGTHAYKFKADKKYYLDPSNRVSLTDGEGYENSYMSLGDTLFFELQGNQAAQEAFVVGSFNGWNERELRMQRSSTGWQLPYVLAPGVHAYKFIIDGNWQTDPKARLKAGDPPFENSILVVKPNVRFRLAGHEDAQQVVLAGSFNGWDEQSLQMQRDEQGWFIDYHLAPGKHTYKFKIDDRWIIDPANELWENNEFDTNNSVIWMLPKVIEPLFPKTD